ncbi:histone acetyltransferase p300 [Microplitis demolitor]|uniref:histone acetyltransferase p300 n=1 Tax=Microplitis demolitor TaxID=69319 RepID=UPI0004400196|nr:histone acetyltransferase p300 [Microplitis demolitor]
MAAIFKKSDYSPSASESTCSNEEIVSKSPDSSTDDTNMTPNESMMWLVHVLCQCKNIECKLSNCQQFRKVFKHLNKCDKRIRGHCKICQQFISLCYYHVDCCEMTSDCQLPFCAVLKEHVKNQEFPPRFQDTYKHLGLQRMSLPESLQWEVTSILSSEAKSRGQVIDFSVQLLPADTTSDQPKPYAETNVSGKIASLFAPTSTDSPFAHEYNCSCALCWRVNNFHLRFLARDGEQ